MVKPFGVDADSANNSLMLLALRPLRTTMMPGAEAKGMMASKRVNGSKLRSLYKIGLMAAGPVLGTSRV